ncbi:MAG TPA: ureidoglycolate lyase [Alphaproteobacteria bacterium]|nr:ureidoglycolate lyase [Alphaproteobacteria bacterium]
MPDTASNVPRKTVDLTVQALTPEAFSPFGQVLGPTPDGKLYGPDDAQLDLGRGIPRFYVMALKERPMMVRYITRHMQVTQCLASVGAKPWLIAVAPPNDPDDKAAKPDPKRIAIFHVPGTLGIKLHRSTWHAGPFFKGKSAEFFNLELSDTNQGDFYPVYLDKEWGIEIRPAGPLAEI